MLPQSAASPTAPPAPATADTAALDAAMERLTASKGAWAAASLGERIAVLKEIRSRLLDQV